MRHTGPMALGGSFAATLAAAQDGEQWAWDALYRSLAGPVRGYLRARGAFDPDDVLGEVFLDLARSVGTFEGDESRFRSWVFMVAHNRMVDERRREIRRPSHPTPPESLELVEGARDTEGEALAGVSTDGVRRLLAGLTPDQRAVLELRLIAGLTIDEVAAVVGKPSGAVKALQRRAIWSLRREIAPTGVPL